MMVYLTFAYFLLVFLFILYKRGLDVSACIIGIYMLTSLCSIYLLNNSPEYINKTPGGIPSLIYCTMITLVAYPFYKFNSTQKRSLPKVNPRLFNILSWLLICGFIFSAILFKDDIIMRLVLGDEMGDLRGKATEVLGVTAQARLSGPMRLLSSFFMVILSMSPISFLLFFYSVVYLKKKWYFNVLLFISSFGCLIASVIGIDRSVFFYWIIDFVFIYVMFRPYLTKKWRRIISVLSVGLLGVAGIYLYMITIARFEGNEMDSILDYMGQNYLNFCWFWDNYDAPIVNWGFFFPISSHFLNIDWGAPVEAVSFGHFVELRVGYFVNLFYTFMGSVMLYLGQWAVVPFCVLYYFIANRMLNKNKIFGMQSLMRLFILAVVPYCGVILYQYVDYIKFLSAIIMLILCARMDKKAKRLLYFK